MRVDYQSVVSLCVKCDVSDRTLHYLILLGLLILVVGVCSVKASLSLGHNVRGDERGVKMLSRWRLVFIAV